MSVQAAVLSMADAIAHRLGILQRKLRAEDLLRAAGRRAGSDDFGDMSFLGYPCFCSMPAPRREASLKKALIWTTLPCAGTRCGF